MRLVETAALTFSLLVLTACASNIPSSISKAGPQDPGLASVRADVESFTGHKVRWGGEITSVKPQAEVTLVELVGRDLSSFGRPQESDNSEGRFMARITGFLDPAVYKQGRQFTVAGVVTGTMEQSIGEHQYTYPVVEAETYHLWEPQTRSTYYDYYPWYHDPWYDIWGSPYYLHRRPYYW